MVACSHESHFHLHYVDSREWVCFDYPGERWHQGALWEEGKLVVEAVRML